MTDKSSPPENTKPAVPADPMREIHKFLGISSAVLAIAGGALGFLVGGLPGLGVGAAIGMGIMAVPASIFFTYARLGAALKTQAPEAKAADLQASSSGKPAVSRTAALSAKFNGFTARVKSSASGLQQKIRALRHR